MHFPYFDLYRKQVIKQADLVLAMHLRGDAFTPEQKARNFAYYEALTVRDSSLSAATQAVLAAEVGQIQLAYDYLGEAARMDLDDLEHNVRDGIHLAALAGTWTALVAGFGGLRLHNSALSFAPRLPEGITRLAFHVRFRNRRLRVEVRATEVTYCLLDGAPLGVWHHGDEIALSVDEPITRPSQWDASRWNTRCASHHSTRSMSEITAHRSVNTQPDLSFPSRAPQPRMAQ